MTASATLKKNKKPILTILQRVAEKDKTAVADCLDAYGNFIWALARKFTASNEETEAAAQEIFDDILAIRRTRRADSNARKSADRAHCAAAIG